MPIDASEARRESPEVGDLLFRSEIDHGGDPESFELGEIASAEAMKAVGSVDRVPAKLPTVARRVAPQISKVEAGLERS